MPNRAKLQQDKTTFVFEYDPQSFRVSYSTNIAANQVLDKNNPDCRAQSTAVTYKLSRCLLVANGLNVSQADKIKQLEGFVRLRKPLSFTYGTVRAGEVFIADLEYEIKSWLEGKPAWIEIELTLKVANSGSKKENDLAMLPQSTPRMVEENKDKVASILSVPSNQRKFNVFEDYEVNLDRHNKVTIKSRYNTAEYKLSDFGIT